MELLLVALAQLGVSFSIALVCTVSMTIAARKYVPQVATEPVGTIIIACLAVLIHLAALLAI